MRSRIADFHVTRVVDDDRRLPRHYQADPPDRLGLGHRPVEVWLTDVLAPAEWPAWLQRLHTLAAIDSDHLPCLIEAGAAIDGEESGARGYYVTEWTDGISLAAGPNAASAGEAGEPVGSPPDLTGRILAVADAAIAAHDLHHAGVVHNDIRPATIVVTSDGGRLHQPAAPVPAGRTAQVTRAADMDTIDPGLLAGAPPSRASDIWALGATLHAAVSHRSLYPHLADASVIDGLRNILAGASPTPDPDLADAPLAIISDCLAADPRRRPASAAAVAESLHAWLESQ